MRVADYRDKEWDARYEQFKIARERRKRAELQSLSNSPAANTSSAAPAFKPRFKTNAKPELRTPANHTQSRFLRTHSTSQPTQNMQQNRAVPTHVHIESAPHSHQSHHSNQSESVVIENIEVEKRKFTLIDALPYIFIALGVIIIVVKVV